MNDVHEEPRRRYPGLNPNILHMLERLINAWRAFNGPQRDMIFRREHEPGRMGFLKFTDASALHVTIVRVRVRIFDDRLECFLGVTPDVTPQRGEPISDSRGVLSTIIGKPSVTAWLENAWLGRIFRAAKRYRLA